MVILEGTEKILAAATDIDIAFIPSEDSDPWVEAAVHGAF